MKLLLFSNSKAPDGTYLTNAIDAIGSFTSGLRSAVFVPFAGVTTTWDEYTAKVANAIAPLGVHLLGMHEASEAQFDAAELIIVGGGNTFQLIKECRARGLLKRIRTRAQSGTPYIGWSAGANLVCPTICTTNDMPIVEPMGLDALRLLEFQINPHYTNSVPVGHQGESRDQRVAEYLTLNREAVVLGLPEGDWIHVDGSVIQLLGNHPACIFRFGHEKQWVAPPTEMSPQGLPIRGRLP